MRAAAAVHGGQSVTGARSGGGGDGCAVATASAVVSRDGASGRSRVESSTAYATQCQVANSATKIAISTAEATRTGSCARGRAASQLASQMLRGNSTTR